jgi:predicted nucleic acid-binding protein
MQVSVALAQVRRVYIETAPFIYIVERPPASAEIIANIFQFINLQAIEMFTSTVTLTEVLTKPIKLGDKSIEQRHLDLFNNTQLLSLIPVTKEIALQAAQLRAAYGLRTPDALHLATALNQGCNAFLTNDKALRRVSELPVLVLDDLQI